MPWLGPAAGSVRAKGSQGVSFEKVVGRPARSWARGDNRNLAALPTFDANGRLPTRSARFGPDRGTKPGFVKASAGIGARSEPNSIADRQPTRRKGVRNHAPGTNRIWAVRLGFMICSKEIHRVRQRASCL